MEKDDVLANIEQLAHEEHELRKREGHSTLTEQERERLLWIEGRLAQ